MKQERRKFMKTAGATIALPLSIGLFQENSVDHNRTEIDKLVLLGFLYIKHIKTNFNKKDHAISPENKINNIIKAQFDYFKLHPGKIKSKEKTLLHLIKVSKKDVLLDKETHNFEELFGWIIPKTTMRLSLIAASFNL